MNDRDRLIDHIKRMRQQQREPEYINMSDEMFHREGCQGYFKGIRVYKDASLDKGFEVR